MRISFVENISEVKHPLTGTSRLKMSNPDGNPEPGSDAIHAGYTPEQGILSRMREWTDVFGWLRLVRVLRIAGSPIALGIVALTLAVWATGLWALELVVFGDSAAGPPSSASGWIRVLHAFDAMLRNYLAAIPSSLLGGGRLNDSAPSGGTLGIVMFVVWSLLVWTTTLLYLVRQGGLLTAGRHLDHSKMALRSAMNRTPQAWFVAAMPLVCGLLIGCFIIVIALVSRITMGIMWIELIFAVGIAIVALLGGILLFGANFAVPLGWAALINEPQADALDSLSRGLEYLYRRPLQLAVYLAVATFPSVVAVWLSANVATAASRLAARMLSIVGASQDVPQMTEYLLSQFPTVVAITVASGMVGGIYLLLRSDAGGQEVEDIWMDEAESTTSLPELTTSE